MKSKKHTILDRSAFIEISTKTAVGIDLAPFTSMTTRSAAKAKTVQGACYHDCPDRCRWEQALNDVAIHIRKRNLTNRTKKPLTKDKKHRADLQSESSSVSRMSANYDLNLRIDLGS